MKPTDTSEKGLEFLIAKSLIGDAGYQFGNLMDDEDLNEVDDFAEDE